MNHTVKGFGIVNKAEVDIVYAQKGLKKKKTEKTDSDAEFTQIRALCPLQLI